MVYKIDYVDGDVLIWSVTESGVECEVDESYTPTIYVSVHGDGEFSTARAALQDHPSVVRVAVVDERVSFRHDPEQVLRVDVVDLKAVTSVARMVSRWGSPGEYRCYNVDFSREFRYCLEEEIDPLPTRELSQMQIAVSETELASARVTELTIDDETVTGSGEDVLTTLSARVESVDPDVLFLNTSDLIPVLFQQADRLDVEFQLGRRSGWQQLAGESTYESYGQVGHSPARYNLPGRVIIDGSNTFMWNQTNLDGCLYLVEQSGKPLQELAWSSIGNILTGIQIQEARERNVLVPWRSWRHEKFKTMRQLHDADRGGFTFAPDVGLHEDVHELDFSSLYPNIIVTRNVSPEKIRCECHAGREDVPGIGYSICDERGYLPDVLEPLIKDRDAIKAEIRETEDEERRDELEGRSSAIKWILVSCFGYQGFSNAKFGRIECHEAINAYAREILLETKAVLEEHGWRIVHGIVDSVWVTPIEDEEQTSLSELVSEISEEVAIRLEHEAHYDWIAFVPLRDSDAGALTKYFGKVAGEDEYKYRGIECRQRSTPSYIDEAQKAVIRAVDEYRDPEVVCEELRSWVDRLERGAVDPNELVITNRVSKKREDYTQSTRSVAALERAAELGLTRAPGQSVSYVVVDDTKDSRERVMLASEELDEYDVGCYRELLVRAAASVLSPLGWRERRIEQFLSSHDEISLNSFL
ncbi:DNA polymerase I [Haladaptatus paucihalophilus DX253]|uniref:DNA-directed DNA polymerase n=1 Tax=Haladaptatus paucihalophilus DX253 TaxID=797209 RepID=E7QMP5_HALPU|nr:type B DNA-directed DNA polymerase [Haladaptatus paucihalophilus]EFW94229.1 DNA polymerase I [Haladaptatus paucihalophilus DX253]SHL34405.1 DNA polymerase I [Haladaptatus paucihalophilus DX253]